MNQRAFVVIIFTTLMGANTPMLANTQTNFSPSPLPAKTVAENLKHSKLMQTETKQRAAILSVISPNIIVTKNMPYAALRKQLLAEKWQPLVDPECKQNVGGGDVAGLCTQKPELEACSGQGHCRVNFLNKNKRIKLTIITYGREAGVINLWFEPYPKQ